MWLDLGGVGAEPCTTFRIELCRLARACYQQDGSGSAEDAANCGRKFLVMVSGDADRSISYLGLMSIAHGDWHDEGQDAEHQDYESD
jgi:hypothetical protein